MPRMFKCYPKESFSRDEKGLHKISSDNCDFSVYYHPFYIIKKDGKIIFNGDHPPDEKWIIEETGKNLIDLTNSGESYFLGDKVCLNCFKSDNSNDNNEGGCTCEKPNFVSLEDLEGKICPKCNKGVIKSDSTGVIT